MIARILEVCIGIGIGGLLALAAIAYFDRNARVTHRTDKGDND